MFPPPNPKQPQKPNPNGSTDPEKPQQNNNLPKLPFNIPRWSWLVLVMVLLGWSLLRLPDLVNSVNTVAPIEVPYSFFFDQIEAGNVSAVVMQGTSAQGIFGMPTTYPPDASALVEAGAQQKTSTTFVTTLPPVEDPALMPTLREHNVTLDAQVVQQNPILALLFNFLPLLLIGGLILWQMRAARRATGGVFGFGRTNAREYTTERPQIKFTDVAGQETAKSELAEIVDFLKEPEKYIALGARIPRGVLLVGPPGTGKTLLARAVAGEANVAFFSISASEFVEMFVGVGASRVRDLFAKAKAASPSIVFIDEIDAVGRQRGAGLGGGNDEREQTLNQMLSEMDGFDQTESVIVMAATNRPDVLDPALLRPGRFDRQVTVALPDRKGRQETLTVHTRGKPLDEGVDVYEISRATIGFSGADIANLANEAALTAARHNRKKITMGDFLEAFDRIVLGNQSPPLSNLHERKVVAYHEAGHALVAALTPNADPVLKVTIVPRGQALGVTAMLPDDDRRNYSRAHLMAQMMVLLGGRASEEITQDDVTTGASDDLRRVTSLARRMVSQFGMSETIGPLNFGEDERQPFLGYSLSQGRSYSETTAAEIDAEVRRLVDEMYHRTKSLLHAHRDSLEALTEELLTNEVVNRRRVLEIAGVTPETDSLPADVFEHFSADAPPAAATEAP
jgi:cell division protease FtsH